MNQHPLGEHLSTCSGPDNCAEYAAVLSMTPTQHANYLNDSTARFAQKRSAGARQFRVSQQEGTLTPPNSYDADIAKRRQADATPESTFAAKHAAERRRALDAEYAASPQRTTQPEPRLTAAQLAAFAPPNPYDAQLAKQKENRR